MKTNSTRAPYKWSRQARAAFLLAYAEWGRVDLACQSVGLSRSGAYRVRKKSPYFAAAWEKAKAIGTSMLEDEAHRRAVEGVEEPLVSKGRIVMDGEGNPIMVRRYSDALMALLLKGPDREKAASASNGGGSGDMTRDDVTLAPGTFATDNARAR